MNCKKLDDDTRRYIGDMLLGVNFTTMPISALSEATGVSRPTLAKWIASGWRLWELTSHIPDCVIARLTMHTPDSRESRFLFHAVENAKRVASIRRQAMSGELGDGFKAAEERRQRNQHRQS